MYRHLLITLVPAIALCLLGSTCAPGSTDGDDSVSPLTVEGRLEVGDFTIPAGMRTTVTADVEIVASGNVVIDGDLIADPAISGPGYNITIIAEGDIEVGGTIEAGAPGSGPVTSAKSLVVGKAGMAAQGANDNMPGQDGGSLNIISSKGNVTIKRNSNLVGVSGSDGGSGTLGARGGRGGSVSLCATYGRLRVLGSISLGNGGDGGDATVDTDSLQTILPWSAVLNRYEFSNVGGDSGRLFAFTSTWDWTGIEFYDSLGSPMMDPFIFAADPNTGSITYGFGGNAGSVSVLDDLSVKLLAQFELQRAGSEAPYEEKFTITAADGGRGWMLGGNGGSIIIQAAKWSGRDGVSFEGRAGNGGGVDPRADTQSDCGTAVPAVGAEGGVGGWASVVSPPGIAAITAHGPGDGGNGGRANALGGNGGSTMMEVMQTAGKGGSAIAIGGAGAIGRSSCFPSAIGNGGDGGPASAIGGSGGDGQVRGEGGIADAIAGTGGNGGDGAAVAGLAGTGGPADTKFGAQGTTGQSGDVVELGAEFSEKADDGTAGRTDALASPDTCDSRDYECPDGLLCGS